MSPTLALQAAADNLAVVRARIRYYEQARDVLLAHGRVPAAATCYARLQLNRKLEKSLVLVLGACQAQCH